MRSVVGVDDAARCGPAIADGNVECVDDERGVLLGVDRPADDSAAVGIEDRSAVDPAFARAMLRDVRDPELVRMRPRELPVHEIIGRDDASKTFGPDRAGEPVDPGLMHELEYGLIADGDPVAMVSSAWTRRYP